MYQIFRADCTPSPQLIIALYCFQTNPARRETPPTLSLLDSMILHYVRVRHLEEKIRAVKGTHHCSPSLF